MHLDPRLTPIVAVTCIALLLDVGPLTGQQRQQASASPSELIARTRGATVSIRVTTPTGGKSGSGLVLSGDGLIVTNAHVIAGGTSGTVRLESGEEYEISGVREFDPRLDIAIISIPGFGLREAQLGNSDSLVVGQRLLAIGAPLGLEWTVSDGILSAVRIEDGVRRLQISVPVSPGSSGGPVISEDGRVIGLVVSGVVGGSAQNLNFAVPINTVRGRIAGAAVKASIPLSSMSYPASNTQSSGSNATAGVPAVNTDLQVDFTSLDGAQSLSETKGQGQYRLRSRTRYTIGRTPSGVTRLDRFVTSIGRTQGLVAGHDLHRDDLHTSLFLSSPPEASSQFTRESFAAGIDNSTSDLAITGSQYVLHEAGSQRSGETAVGVYPGELIAAVIASLSDSAIKGTNTIWVFSPGGEGARETTVTWKSSGRLRIKVPANGTECDENTLTRDLDVDVHFLALRNGPNNVDLTVLAARPHLNVGAEVKCVYTPSLRAGDQRH